MGFEKAPKVGSLVVRKGASFVADTAGPAARHLAGAQSTSVNLRASKASDSRHPLSNKKYYLAGGRLARPKHIDLIIKTFSKLKLPLKIFGRGFAGYGLELKSKVNSNIEFLEEVSDEEKFKLMKDAKAFIITAEDEDFGITPVEAMSVGTPVIAYRSGGVLESVIEGKTGLFFDELSIESLTKAIKKFNNLTINAVDCISQAQKFSKERFRKEISAFIKNKI